MLKSSLWNFLFSQACWFACVLGGAQGNHWLGPALTGLFAIQVIFLSSNPRREAIFLALAALLGSLGDRLVVALGVYSFQQPCLVPWGYPLWMTSLWIAFAGMFGYGLAWLNERRLPAGVLGAVGGPLAYSAGAKLGAIAFTATLAKASLIIGAYWAFIVPALLALRAALPGGPEQKEL